VVTSLPGFITVLAFLGCHHSIPNDKETACPMVEEVIRESPFWDVCLRLWAESHDHLQPVTPRSVLRHKCLGHLNRTYSALCFFNCLLLNS
jgi:hypothetical protein